MMTRTRRAAVGSVLLAVAVALFAAQGLGQQGCAVVFIIDMSGSMSELMGGTDTTREDAAKSQFIQILPSVGIPFEVRVFGWLPDWLRAPDRCDTAVALEFGQDRRHRDEARALIALMTPDRYTPIAQSLQEAVYDLLDYGCRSGGKIVLITDGHETCGGDPVAKIRALKEMGFEFDLYIIGYDVSDDDQAELARVVEAAGPGSQLFRVTKPEEIGPTTHEVLTQVTGPSRIRITNGGNMELLVFFNGLYKGVVAAGGERTFETFVGSVTVSCAAKGYNLWEREVVTEYNRMSSITVVMTSP